MKSDSEEVTAKPELENFFFQVAAFGIFLGILILPQRNKGKTVEPLQKSVVTTFF